MCVGAVTVSRTKWAQNKKLVMATLVGLTLDCFAFPVECCGTRREAIRRLQLDKSPLLQIDGHLVNKTDILSTRRA
jgi:hypothetical protein